MANTVTKFKKLLAKKDLHGSQIARRIGVTPGLVWKWMNGKSAPRLEHTKKLAEVLGITVEDVIDCFDETGELL